MWLNCFPFNLKFDHAKSCNNPQITGTNTKTLKQPCLTGNSWLSKDDITFCEVESKNTDLPVCRNRNHVPSNGANVCPGFESNAAMPNTRAETAVFLLCRTKSSSTRSLMTRLNSLQVPSVKTRLLKQKKSIENHTTLEKQYRNL